MRYLLFISLLFFFENAFAQFTMEGIVKNEKGENLSFATVFLEGTGFAASTDEKGYYTIKNIPSGSYRLKATFIGYIAHHQDIELSSDIQLDITLQGEIYNLDIIEIQANRASENQPFTKQNLNKYQLQKENTGVDVPFILQWTPSMLVTSDAGTGIGYTGLRLRGSDQTRINVTLNGVPVNDAESHNVFWVDLLI
ncbi:MAG: TonB-dependent receptor [Saprospiraceae bacterium]|nr:TonB-dependent receptor [Saprospiraceae bacterium]